MDGIFPPNRTVTFDRSFAKIGETSLFLIAMWAACVWLGLGGLVESKGWLTVPFGWTASGLIGIVLLIKSLHFLSGRTPLTLSKTGLMDRRLFKNELPWSAVRSVVISSKRRASGIHLRVDPSYYEKLDMTFAGRVAYRLNKPFGAEALIVHDAGLDVSPEWLADTFLQYIAEHNPKAQITRQ